MFFKTVVPTLNRELARLAFLLRVRDLMRTRSNMTLLRLLGCFGDLNLCTGHHHPPLSEYNKSMQNPLTSPSKQGYTFFTMVERSFMLGVPQIDYSLYEHTIDRLSSRWDRFSWFGVQPVSAKSQLPVASQRLPSI